MIAPGAMDKEPQVGPLVSETVRGYMPSAARRCAHGRAVSWRGDGGLSRLDIPCPSHALPIACVAFAMDDVGGDIAEIEKPDEPGDNEHARADYRPHWTGEKDGEQDQEQEPEREDIEKHLFRPHAPPAQRGAAMPPRQKFNCRLNGFTALAPVAGRLQTHSRLAVAGRARLRRAATLAHAPIENRALAADHRERASAFITLLMPAKTRRHESTRDDASLAAPRRLSPKTGAAARFPARGRKTRPARHAAMPQAASTARRLDDAGGQPSCSTVRRNAESSSFAPERLAAAQC